VRRSVGLMFGGERGLCARLTARHSLNHWAALYRLDAATTRERVPRLLDLVGLADRADDRIESYSRGMKQQLHLARELIDAASLLFLGEPTIGLDPVASVLVWEIIKNLQREGVTIFLATHYMQEAESLCDCVAFIDDGSII